MKSKLPVKLKARFLWPFMAALLTINFSTVQGQQVAVTGTVNGEGETLPGVTVQIKGTSSGTVTDLDGNFQLNAGPNDVLIVSFLGFLTQEVTVGNKTNFIITLESDIKSLEEVVVIGYGTQKKKEVTGAVVNLSGEDIAKIPVPDLSTAMQGQIAGVNVQASSGAPGEAANVQIRGLGSLSPGSLGPLYVVDGIPYREAPNIPPSQIKSIDVLKDGASAAIYGVRASNGVILITTNTGKAGKVRVNLSTYQGIQSINSGVELMSTAEQFYFDEIRTNAVNQVPTTLLVNPRALENNTDFIGDVQNDNATIRNYDLNISGGQNNLTVNANVNYFNQEGVMINSGFDRLSTRFTGNYNAGRFKLFASFGASEENRDREPFAMYLQALRQKPYATAINKLPAFADGVQIPDQNEITFSYLARILNNTDETRTKRFNIALRATYDITDDLSYQVRVGRNELNTFRKRFQPQYIAYDFNGALSPTSTRPQAILDEDYRWMTNDVIENVVTYQKSFGNHNLTLTGVLNYEQFVDKNVGIGVVMSENTGNIVQVPSGAVDSENPTSMDDERTLAGKMIRVQYNFDQRYLFSASMRRDGSSQFAKVNRYENFPSVSFGWNVMEESFFNLSMVSDLKVRASWAKVGNNQIAEYSYIPTVQGGVNYLFGSNGTLVNGLIPRNLVDPSIRWETTISKNIGIDASLFDGKLNLTADYYVSDKEDMLLGFALPPSSGTFVSGASSFYSSKVVNAGNMVNKGLELALSYRNTTTNGLKYNVGITFTKNKNEVTNLNGTERGYGNGSPSTIGINVDDVTFLAEGYPAGGFFLVKTDGIINTSEELEAYSVIDPNAKMGDVIYVDYNGDSTINDNDRQYYGSAQPKFEAGINANLTYKKFDLFVQGYYSYGADIYNGSRFTAHIEGRHKEQVKMWSPQNRESEIPVYRGRAHNNVRAFSDLYMEDGTYFRIRSLSLGYTFDLAELIGIESARLYFTSVNPFTFTKYNGYDPEVGGDGLFTRGVDNGNYPIARQFMIGAEIKF
ncbi:MAG: TonB-dependent receptor [Cyclobacteriaceae bacterium]